MSKRPTAKRVRDLLNYDKETGVFTWRMPIAQMKAGARAGTNTAKGYRIISVDGKQYYEHHLAWLFVKGRWPKEIDHRNTNGRDNHWENLRLGNDALNAQNKRRASKSNRSSGVLGVSRQRRSTINPWKAQIRTDGRIKHLGSFPTIEAASAAYVAAKRKYHKGCTL